MKHYFPGLSKRCREYLDRIWEPITTAAREHGYTIGLHGSLNRDIDLVAAPWTDQAWSAEKMVEAVRKAVEHELGFCMASRDSPEDKPHGRRAWALYTSGGPYLDLSVMPLRDYPLRMAKQWKLDPLQYDLNGQLPLYVGDDWSLTGIVMANENGSLVPVDVSGWAVTGFVPAATGGSLPIPASTGASTGSVVLTADPTLSLQAAQSPAGIQPLLVMVDTDGKTHTIPAYGSDVVILTR